MTLGYNSLPFPGTKIADGLTELLRQGARRLIHEAVEAELEAFLEQHRERHDNAGRQAIVRNGYLSDREVLSGVGPVSVKVPRVRDRTRKTGLAMVYKLAMSAQKGWRRLRGFRQLTHVIEGVKFIDGVDARTIEQGRKAA